MSRCQRLPSSTYEVGNDDEKISVTFLNDTGDSLQPAYVDLSGTVQFITGRGVDETWQDRTYFGTNWVWFSGGDTCLGLSASQYDWEGSVKSVTEIAAPSK
jgi:hypothetical protein